MNIDLNYIAASGGLTLTTLPEIINAFFTLALPLAGLILLGIIIYAGFTILTGANNPEKVDQGKKILTQGLIGFFIVFATYWLAQIIEVLTGFPIVSN